MSRDGVIAIAWENTNDPNYYLNGLIGLRLPSVLRQGRTTPKARCWWTSLASTGAAVPRSPSTRATTSWSVTSTSTGNDNIGGPASDDVFAKEYQLYDSDRHTSTARSSVTQFRVNSANFNPTAKDFWPLDQFGGQAAMDADGDLTVSYTASGRTFRNTCSCHHQR